MKISKKRNKNSIRSELPQIAMLPKKTHFGCLGVKQKMQFCMLELWTVSSLLASNLKLFLDAVLANSTCVRALNFLCDTVFVELIYSLRWLV